LVKWRFFANNQVVNNSGHVFTMSSGMVKGVLRH